MCVIILACGRFKKLFIIFLNTHTHTHNTFTNMASHTKRLLGAQQMNSPFSITLFLLFKLEPFNICIWREHSENTGHTTIKFPFLFFFKIHSFFLPKMLSTTISTTHCGTNHSLFCTSFEMIVMGGHCSKFHKILADTSFFIKQFVVNHADSILHSKKMSNRDH